MIYSGIYIYIYIYISSLPNNSRYFPVAAKCGRPYTEYIWYIVELVLVLIMHDILFVGCNVNNNNQSSNYENSCNCVNLTLNYNRSVNQGMPNTFKRNCTQREIGYILRQWMYRGFLSKTGLSRKLISEWVIVD